MPHFFISYAKKDTRELALALSDALNALSDVTAWVDKSLRAGRSWELEIQREIDRCDYMIVLYSPDINRHQRGEEESYMLTEISYAKYTCKKTIIPVMAQKTTPPISLTTAHYIDFTLPRLTLADLVTALIDETGIALFAIPPVPTPPKPFGPPVKPVSSPLPQGEGQGVRVFLPDFFEWIDIPGGKVTLIPDDRDKEQSYLKQNTLVDVPGFAIAKYPLTNAQFTLFIQAGGYNQQKWWTPDGWRARTSNNWTQPRYWEDVKWNQPDHPVVGISWYESVAFCQWLAEATSEKIRLPSETEWQRAAQGDTNWDYPYGPKFDQTRCNFNTSGTTSVAQYSDGASPFGVWEMSGNVWEWCSTMYDTGENDLTGTGIRVLRGGSWRNDNRVYLRVGFRGRHYPYSWNSFGGFRLARSY